ncbi:MAG: chitobiase/beta-hexosaminidase C-terminal domain-containing protein [Verrucomicrobiota bacterium]
MSKFLPFILGCFLAACFFIGTRAGLAQTAFLDFNSAGEYANNFNPWNDVNGVNGGAYAFQENLGDGVGGSGGVSVYQSTDTTATYKSGSWDFATNGSTIIVSTLIYAAGGDAGDKIQLGVINSTTNGLNSNPGVAFESFRFIPASTTSWSAYEQYRAQGVSTTSVALGNVSVIAGHWYKFVVATTNTSGASGNLVASCALYDYGTNGLTPGTNLVNFSTLESHVASDIATNTAVWPALRITDNAAVSAWDNFLVFQTNSPPVMTLKLTNSVVALGSATTFSVLADGPGAISYSWYSNNIPVAGVTTPAYTVSSVGSGFTKLMAVARNGNGSVTNAVTISPVTEVTFDNNGTGWTINQSGLSSANITANVFQGTDGNGGEGVTAWYDGLVFINGFVATFTYQDVGGSPGNNADGLSFDLQESGPTYIGADGGALGISGLSPSADWELNLYDPNGIGIVYNTDGTTFGYQPTGPVNVSSGDPINIAIVYAPGGAVQETLLDTVTDSSYTTNYNIGDVTSLLGSSYAYIGFSSADGGVSSVQTVSDFVFQSGTNGFTSATVTNLPATAIQPTTATLNGQVLSSGGFAPSITLYYGTTDGGTNAGNWANSISVGVETGAFSQSVTGLSPDTTYYYTASASNIGGTAWASPSQSFTTTIVTPPQVSNEPATAIGATTATLNGQLLSTGGAPTTVTFYYGTTDGGNNPAAWNSSIYLGSQSGPFSQTISGLSSNTVYYFTSEATNLDGAVWAAPSETFTTAATNPVSSYVSVLTYHNDNTRWGVNSNETVLTLANVNTNAFGKLFTYTVDGLVYAQPLIMANVNIVGKGTHNVVFVATEHNSLYAFDADNDSGANATALWQTSFINPAAGITTVPNGDVGTSDITPEIGITSTPVIDPVTGTIYVEVKTKEPGPVYVHRLHALDITTGLERTNFNSPVVIACTNYPGVGTGDNDGENPPHVLWNPLREHSRPALTLLNGQIYMSFASHGDNTPYHGWLFAYNATNVSQQLGVYNATPNGGLGGFWDGGGGPSVDSQGNLYLQSGNGTFDGGANISSSGDYSMSLIKFATTNGITMVDYFAPSNAVALSDGDQDLGSAAPIILPDSAGSAAHPHLVVGGGKTSPIYLVDRDNMGRFNGTTGNNLIVQEFNGSSGGDRDTTPAFFNNTLYIMDYNSRVGAYTITNALFNTTPVESPDGYANKGGASACISANGSTNAIAWAVANDGADSPASPAILRAYNATNLTQELYSSDQIASRDSAGDGVKFTIPTIANGKVYVGAQYSLTVYGLATSFVNTPVISPDGGVFTNSVTVTLSDATAGASIYYTLNGTTPSTNSFPYTGPFVLTNSVSVTAGAFKVGAVASGTASASFINSSAIGDGTGLLGQYWANLTSAAFLTPGFNTPPTLTRVDPTINFDWDTIPPSTNIGPDTYVVEWTGSVQPQFNETYTFYTTTDDGVLLYVNGQLLVNEWVDEGPTTWSGQITLAAQQRYNIKMDYYQDGGGAVAQLFWSSPSTGPMAIIPESQLYPETNPPPSVTLTEPANGASYTAAASVTVGADAAAQYNSLASVSFYANSTFLGSVSNLPYALTTTGLAAGSYTLTAVATDGSGLTSTSAPVNITVNPGSGLPYGLTTLSPSPAFFNMPTAIPPTLPGSVPALLSLTGVFSNTPSMIPTNGLIPYNPNVQLWSDGAAKTRYLSVPNVGSPLTADEQIAFAPTGSWTFPAGTVFVKTFQLQTNTSNPNSLHRLETRLLVRDINGAVYGVTYKWRPDNSDADLLTTSSNENIAITTPEGVVTQTWYYPSPADCLTCHTPVANYVLGLSTRQLNGNFTYPSTGVTDNQLRTLNRLGLFNPAFDEAGIANFEQLYALTNASASLESRARSYLDANCVQCHQPGGSGPSFDARYDTPLTNQSLIYGVVNKGTLGYNNPFIVVPDDTSRSILYDRIDTVDSTIKMPPLDRNVIDTNAVAVLAAWINSLPATQSEAPPSINPAGGTFGGSVNITLSPPDDAAILYYTLNGTEPTTNSLLYTGPFTLTNSATVQAGAFETGFLNSAAAMASFTIEPSVYFTGVAALGDNVFQLNLSGTLGASYVLQTSTNLTQWLNLSTNTPATSLFSLTETNTAGVPYKFYRVIELP